VDPAYDFDADKPSFKLWYEHDPTYNPAGAAAHKESPRLVNYNLRTKRREEPFKPDTTRGGLEGRVVVEKRERPMQMKITQVDGAVGREGWRAHVSLGNGVVRWTDDVFDWEANNNGAQHVNGKGKSLFLFPKELEPMYSSFSPDKIFHWKPPARRRKAKQVKKETLEEIVERCERRRLKMEATGGVDGCRPEPRVVPVFVPDEEEAGAGGAVPVPPPRQVRTAVQVLDAKTGELVATTPRHTLGARAATGGFGGGSVGVGTSMSSVTITAARTNSATETTPLKKEDATVGSELSGYSIRSGGFLKASPRAKEKIGGAGAPEGPIPASVRTSVGRTEKSDTILAVYGDDEAPGAAALAGKQDEARAGNRVD
ncbi:hypothetical protein TeGR_g13715, partial [Tetraparma gracilis]